MLKSVGAGTQSQTYTSIYWEAVPEVVPSHLTALFVSEYRPDIQVDELWGYSTKGQNSPEDISIHRDERLERRSKKGKLDTGWKFEMLYFDNAER